MTHGSRLLMRTLNGLRALFRKGHGRELDAELRAFIEESVEERMRAGLNRTDATRAARRELGSLDAVKDRVRDVGWESVAESVWHDVRSRERRFRRNPQALGRTIRLSGVPFTIIGVTPPAFFGVEAGTAPELFLPMMMQPTVMPTFENLLANPIVTSVPILAGRDFGPADLGEHAPAVCIVNPDPTI